MNAMQTTQPLPVNWSPRTRRSSLPVHEIMVMPRCADVAASKAITQTMEAWLSAYLLAKGWHSEPRVPGKAPTYLHPRGVKP